MKAGGVSECLRGDSSFFLQIPCTIADDVLVDRQVQGLFIGCMGAFIALFYISFIDFLKSLFKSTAVEWDVKTITAGDYCVELQITKTMWDTFIATIYNPEDHKPKLNQFRDYLSKEMSKRLTKLPDLGYEDEPPERINISLITFAFDNNELINILRARGNAIKFENFDEMRKINQKIDTLKRLNLQKYCRPVSAFLTFENEEGLNRCLNYNDTV
jgi:hypothetical protein